MARSKGLGGRVEAQGRGVCDFPGPLTAIIGEGGHQGSAPWEPSAAASCFFSPASWALKDYISTVSSLVNNVKISGLGNLPNFPGLTLLVNIKYSTCSLLIHSFTRPPTRGNSDFLSGQNLAFFFSYKGRLIEMKVLQRSTMI